MLCYRHKKRAIETIALFCFAEAGGFEPPVQLPVRQFSKLVVSATHPNFLLISAKPQKRCKDRIIFLYLKIKKLFLFKKLITTFTH